VKSSDYGVAIQRGGDGRLVVIGAGQATYSELIYDAKGASSLAAATSIRSRSCSPPPTTPATSR